MPRFSLDYEDVLDEAKANEIEPPHPIGFGSPWGRTWISLDPPPMASPARSTYALDSLSDDEDEDNFLSKQGQAYPPLSSYVHSKTASTTALLQYQEPEEYDYDHDESEEEEDDVMLLRRLVERQTLSLAQITSPSKPLPSWSQTRRKIDQKIQLERQRMQQEHAKANQDVQGVVNDLERQVSKIMKYRQAEEDALRKQEQEDQLRKEAQAKQEAKEKERQERHEKEIQTKMEHKRLEGEKQKKDRQAKVAQKTEYVAKAKKLVAQLIQVRASIEPFDKNKAVGKRRLGMKKIVRGKVNTLNENAGKIQEVAREVSQAITTARQEDEQIKQGLERKDPGLTPDMARGKRYLVDLLAANTIQRVQAEGFNGPRGDGFPLAAMLAMVSLENKELVPILAAHIYTVCPTAIPTLPKPSPDASEEALMSSLGMLKDKKGEFESFDRFLSRTENIVSLVANIMASSPSTHILLGGHKGAVDWLTRFLEYLPPAPTAPLPLLTAPVLHGFLSGAGHMLANKHPEEFRKLLDVIIKDVLKRLDDGAIGKPSSIRLAKFLEDGFEGFRATLPPRALSELYYGATGSHGHGNSGTSGGSSSVLGQPSSTGTSSSNPFGSSTANASPFGQPTGTSDTAPFGKGPAGAGPSNPFGGGGQKTTSGNSGTFGASSGGASPFGGTSASSGGNNPFGGAGATNNASNENSMSDAPPLGGPKPINSPFGAPSQASSTSFGGGAPSAPNPFGGGSSSGAGGFGSTNTQTTGGFGASSNAGLGGATPAPSPFGAQSSSFSSNANTNSSPFGAPQSGNQSTAFGGNQGQSASPFSTGLSSSQGGSSFAGGGQTGGFGGGNSNASFGGSNPGNKGNKQPCRFFAKGSCRFGDNCRFSHETGGGGGGGGGEGGGGGGSFGGGRSGYGGNPGYGSSNSSPFAGPRR